MLPGSANLSPIKGPPSGCIALLPQLSALFCLCLKFLLSKMFTARQVSLKAPTFVWGRFFSFSVFIPPVSRKLKSLWTCLCKCSLVIFFVTLGVCISPQSWERAVGAPGVGAVAVS